MEGGRKKEMEKCRVELHFLGPNLMLNHMLFSKLHSLLLIDEPCFLCSSSNNHLVNVECINVCGMPHHTFEASVMA